MTKSRGTGKKGAIHSLEVDASKGIITSFGQRFLFIPVELIHSIEDRLADMVGPMTATSFQYEIGKRGGSHYIHMVQKLRYGIKMSKVVAMVAANLRTLCGLGKLTGQVVDFKKKSIRSR